MFKKVRIDDTGIVISLKRREGKTPETVKVETDNFICKECRFIAKTKSGLRLHNRKHKI